MPPGTNSLYFLVSCSPLKINNHPFYQFAVNHTSTAHHFAQPVEASHYSSLYMPPKKTPALF